MTPANDDYRLLFVIDEDGDREPTEDDVRDFAGLARDGARTHDQTL